MNAWDRCCTYVIDAIDCPKCRPLTFGKYQKPRPVLVPESEPVWRPKDQPAEVAS